jgi:hypothetical protein
MKLFILAGVLGGVLVGKLTDLIPIIGMEWEIGDLMDFILLILDIGDSVLKVVVGVLLI